MKEPSTALDRRVVQEGSVLVDEGPEEIVFAGLDWLPADFEQAMERARRTGMRSRRVIVTDHARFRFGFADGSEATMNGFPFPRDTAR